MKSYINYLAQNHRSLIVDTNLLILYLVGNNDIRHIADFKRTQAYSTDDYIRLATFMKLFKEVVTTPNILTEVTNLTDPLNKKLGHKLFPIFSHSFKHLSEKQVDSVSASAGHSFAEFGLSDSVMVELSKMKYLILTDDLPFYSYLETRNIAAVNFNHIRLI